MHEDLIDKKIKGLDRGRKIKRAMREFCMNYATCGSCGHIYEETFKSYCGICEKCGSENTDEFKEKTMRLSINKFSEITGFTFKVSKKMLPVWYL